MCCFSYCILYIVCLFVLHFIRSGALQIGDHIRSINGTVTDHLTNAEATSLLKTAGNVVNLEIAFDAVPDGGCGHIYRRIFGCGHMYIISSGCGHMYIISGGCVYALISGFIIKS